MLLKAGTGIKASLMEKVSLFKLQEWQPPAETCRTCCHRQRWQRDSKVIQYCGIRASQRTHNKLLKIKCKTAACRFYKDREDND